MRPLVIIGNVMGKIAFFAGIYTLVFFGLLL